MNRLQADRSCDFNQFTSMVHSLLKAAWGDDWGTFCEEFPNGRDPEHVKLPVITYSITRKVPASYNGREEIKPRHREDFILPEGDAGEPEAVTVFGQSFDHLIAFTIWDENNSKANELADRFEDFMMVYTGYFMQNGVQQIIFRERSNSTDSQWFRDNLVVRKFVYLVRLEKQVVIPTGVFNEIIVRASNQ